MSKRPAWRYTDSAGVERLGTVVHTSDFGGTDTPYMFRSVDGVVSVLSGSLLKKAVRLHGETVEIPDNA
jgi:hypothetical protein